jgi:hypothetical protein
MYPLLCRGLLVGIRVFQTRGLSGLFRGFVWCILSGTSGSAGEKRCGQGTTGKEEDFFHNLEETGAGFTCGESCFNGGYLLFREMSPRIIQPSSVVQGGKAKKIKLVGSDCSVKAMVVVVHSPARRNEYD